MANKKITYSIDGKVKEISSSYYDANNNLVINKLSISTASVLNIPDGILFTNNGQISSSAGSSGQVMVYDGGWKFKTPEQTSIIADNIPDGSDVSGTFGNAKVKRLSNVNSGTLPVSRGGTGLTNSDLNYSGYSLFTSGSNNKLQLITASANPTNNPVLMYNGSSWSTITQSVNTSAGSVDVTYYLTSSGSPFTWTKPLGTRHVRVILQGAGGGGGAGGNRSSTSTQGAGGGGGGAAGSFIDYSFIADETLETASISIGVGGAGGTIAAAPGTGNAGLAGGDTTFTIYPTNISIIAEGGDGGGGGGNAAAGASRGLRPTTSTTNVFDSMFEKCLTKNGSAGTYGSSGSTAVDGAGNPYSDPSNTVFYDVDDSISSAYKNYYQEGNKVNASFRVAGGGSGGGLIAGTAASYVGGSSTSAYSGLTNNGITTSRNGKSPITSSIQNILSSVLGVSVSNQIFLASGGGGGASNHNSNGAGGSGSSGISGSGGGGGGAGMNMPNGSLHGGNGGDGYAIVVSYKY